MAVKMDEVKDTPVPTGIKAMDRPDFATDDLGRTTFLRFSRTATLGSAGTALIALAGLIGYVPGLGVFGSVRPDYIPMAPSTAGCFLILSAILFCHVKKNFQGSGLMVMLVLLSTAFGLMKAIQPLAGINLEDWLFPEAGVLGTIPVGRMSPATGAGFMISGLGTFLLLRSRSSRYGRRLGNWTSSLGGLTVLVGATVLLAYLYGTPLMYGGGTVPMAITTAASFIFLGAALLAAAGPKSFPTRLLMGDSTSARLSRAFIPLTVAVILLQSILSRLMSVSFAGQHVIFLAVLVIVVTPITMSIVARVAHSIGNDLDEFNRQLNESEARLNSSVKNSPFPIMIHAEDGEVVAISDTWTEITGYSPDEIPTIADWTERAYGERKQSVQKHIDNLYNLSTKIREGEYLVTTKSGEQRVWDFMSSGLGVTNDGRRMVISMAIDITEQKHIQKDLDRKTELLNRTGKLAKVGGWELEIPTMQLIWTDEVYRIYEVDPATPLSIQMAIEFYALEAQPVIETAAKKAIADGTPWDVELPFITSKGKPLWVRTQGSAVIQDGKTVSLHGTFQDVTERIRAELDLRIAATAFEAQEAIIVTDARTVIMRVNSAFSRVTGFSAEEAIGKTPSMLKSGHHEDVFFRDMWENLIQNRYWQGEIWNRRKNGEVHPDWLTITAVSNASGQITNYVSSFSDITQHKKDEEAIHSLAFYDPLTNLPNRRLLLDRLQHSLAASNRHENHGALLFIDLDNFKTLNDTRGHNIGDLLLIEVSKRLQGCVREGDTVARLGGDEFVVMLQELSEDTQQAATQARAVGDKILAAISQFYSLQGHEYYSSTSIGIGLFCSQEITVEELLKRADTAMYQAKRAGRNTLRFYDPAMRSEPESLAP